jgi:HEAT repeat protein
VWGYGTSRLFLLMTMTTDDPLPDLVLALESEAPAERVRAAKTLGRLGWLAKDALPALSRVLDDDDARAREAAAYAVGQIGPDALPVLSAMLDHHDKYVRRNSVRAMAKLGPLARPALSDLCRTLKDADPRTASGAAQALGSMGREAAEAVPHLAEAMRGANIVLCRLAAKALSEIGPPALATLIVHLQHSDPFVRGESALALGWMGSAARSAVPFLLKLVRRAKTIDDVAETPMPVGELDSIGKDSDTGGLPSEAITPTLPPSGGKDISAEDTCRLYAVQALGRIGNAASSALPDLRAATQLGPNEIRKAAQQAIQLIQEA